MSWVTSIISGLVAVKEIVKLFIELWSAMREIQRKAQENRAVEGNESGNTIEIERGLGNPDAGKPSGIGKVRDKK